jgi:hypothetical protein
MVPATPGVHATFVVPVETNGDSSKGTGAVLGMSSKKSKDAHVGGEETSKKGKEFSSKTTWREMMRRLEGRSRQRYPLWWRE